MNGPAYIGGEFREGDNEPYLRVRGDAGLHFPARAGDASRACFETGSDALAAVLAGLGNPARVWIPEHFCMESVRRAQGKASLAWEAPVYGEVESLRGRARPGDAVLFLHFNGLDSAGAARAAALAAGAGAVLIEDFVHAPFDIARFRGAAAFNSLRKVACLETAVAYCRLPMPAGARGETEYLRLKKRAVKAKDGHAARPEPALEKEYLALYREAEDALSRDGNIVGAGEGELETLGRLDFGAIREARRSNHARLVGRLSGSGVHFLPGEGAYAMARFRDRDRLRDWLSQRGVFPAIHWRDCGTPLSEEILSFHIDQRYGAADMDRLAELIAGYSSTHSSSA